MLKVAVVGGSIGGLTAALKLRDCGCDVHVFERSAADLQARGAGILAHPMTLRYFAENHVLDLAEITVVSRRHIYVDGRGRVVHEERIPYRFAAWNTLYRSLRGCLEPDRYHLGQLMTAVEQDAGGVRVWFASGHLEECDLLVCADGISSTGRNLLLPEVRPVYAGYVAWRGTVPETELTAATRSELDGSIIYHLLDHGHVIAYPIPSLDGSTAPGHGLVNLVWYRNVPAGPALADLLTGRDGQVHEISMPPGAVGDQHLEELREAALDLPPVHREVVRACAAPFIQAMVDVEVPRMAFGRVCLIGDAAFTTRPHAGAGTAKACADGWALAEAVVATAGDAVRALQLWEPEQLELGRGLVHRNRVAGDRSQFGGNWDPGDPALRYGLWAPGDAGVAAGGRAPAEAPAWNRSRTT